MESHNYFTPDEIESMATETGVKKAKRPFYKEIILAIMAGAFIAFAAQGSTTAAYNLIANPDTYGLGRLVTGLVFTPGLMLVLLAGGELFTGNTLIELALLEKKIKLNEMLKNWFIVYMGNLIGALLIVFMMYHSGILNNSGGILGGVALKTAVSKVNMPFYSALISGIMCNWLVCLAIWMCYGSTDLTGKIFASFFVIGLFAISGFEHCVANMYYIPIGLLAKTNELWTAQSGLAADKLASLNIGSFAFKNLLPVTIGNIIGGAVFVAGFYWLVYRKGESTTIKK